MIDIRYEIEKERSRPTKRAHSLIRLKRWFYRLRKSKKTEKRIRSSL